MNSLVINADARRIPLADRSAQMAVTSPPYWGLREYGVDGQVGLESTPGAYVAELVSVFREVRRILRDDGTLWLNLGDSYANDTKWGGSGGSPSSKNYTSGLGGCVGQKAKRNTGLKPKDLVGIPWRVALALQADGWYLRAEIIWHKRSPMPEPASDRPTRSHEQVFLLTKSDRYFYDAEAVKEKAVSTHPSGNGYKRPECKSRQNADGSPRGQDAPWQPVETRNLRTVWTLSSEPYKGAHFATFPRALVEPCIKAGTSGKGCCPHCRSPWERIVERERVATRPGKDTKCLAVDEASSTTLGWNHPNVIGNRDPQRHTTVTRTVGWNPSCDCPAADPIPCVVFDPFGGAGTTAVVAEGLKRRAIVTELNPNYCRMARRRIDRPHSAISKVVGTEILPLFGDLP